jgi:hypothetical protein
VGTAINLLKRAKEIQQPKDLLMMAKIGQIKIICHLHNPDNSSFCMGATFEMRTTLCKIHSLNDNARQG